MSAFTEVWELRGTRTSHVGTTVGLCDSQARLIVGTVKIKSQFCIPLKGIEEHVDKHAIYNWQNLGISFPDGCAWVWELSEAQILLPAVPYVHKRGHQTWIKLKEPGMASETSKKRQKLG